MATVLITVVDNPDFIPDTEIVGAAEDDESLGEVEMSPLAMVTQGIHQVRPNWNHWIDF